MVDLLIIAMILLLGAAVLAMWLRERESRDLLDDLIKALKDAGLDIRHHQPRSKHRMSVAPENDQTADQTSSLITGPPQVDTEQGPVALGDWLQHYAPDVTWPQATTLIYNGLTEKPEVIDYFPNKEVTPQVKAHFANMFADIARRGIYQEDLDELVRAHAHVRNSKGERLTEHTWNEVLITVAKVLTSVGVPGDAIGDLARRLEPVRVALIPA